MIIQNIPKVFLQLKTEPTELFVYDFKMTKDAVNTKVNLTHNMFSFFAIRGKKSQV